jgi:hypothetical protein
VVQLNSQCPAIRQRHGLVKTSVTDPQVIKQTQGLPGEVSEFRVGAFSFQFRDDN